MQVLFFAASLSTSPATGNACALPVPAEAATLKREAQSAFSAGNPARAAELWRRAANLYPPCVTTYPLRIGQVIRALNALKKIPADSSTSCSAPSLETARLVRQTHAELMALPDDTRGLREARAEFAKRLAGLSHPASDTAAFLDPAGPSLPIATAIDRYALATAAFGACQDFRSALTRHTLAALPPKLPDPPACDPETDKARQMLRQALEALERAEPDVAKSTAEHVTLSYRLATLDAVGPTLSTTRAKAAAEADHDRRADAWSTLARGLPTCSVYLTEKHDAAAAAVAAWQQKGHHSASPTERDEGSRVLLDVVIAELEADYGSQAANLREHQSLTRSRAALDRPQQSRAGKQSSEVEPAPAVPAKPEPVTPITRHRPERNLIEIGVIGGVMAPASGLLDDAGGSHQLYDAKKKQAADDAGIVFYRPYRKVAPELGLRVAWFPISHVGGEIEGGVMPTRVIESGAPGARSTLFNFRAHLIVQTPLWRVTPFVLVGGGALGTTGALGKDVDPSLNFGGGVKVFLSNRFMLRLDIRDTIATRKGSNNGGAHYPEILLGLSLILNRKPSSRPPPAGSGLSPAIKGNKP